MYLPARPWGCVREPARNPFLKMRKSITATFNLVPALNNDEYPFVFCMGKDGLKASYCKYLWNCEGVYFLRYSNVCLAFLHSLPGYKVCLTYNKLAKHRRHASRVHFAKIHVGKIHFGKIYIYYFEEHCCHHTFSSIDASIHPRSI